MHERDLDLINDYTLFDEAKGVIPKIDQKKIGIKPYKKFLLIRTEENTKKKSVIYFDIQGSRYSYAVLTEFSMKVVGSYCTHGDPFDALTEDLSKYETHSVKIVYPRKQILEAHNPKKFHVVWDSFQMVDPNHKEIFLKKQLVWNKESPFYTISKKYTNSDIAMVLNQGKVYDIHKSNKPQDPNRLQSKRQFHIDEILV